VKRTHEQGRKIRFWATAENEAMWRELLRAKVDFINTDKLDELQRWLLENGGVRRHQYQLDVF
jgi:glycerophosphoryl diester phosphodiesterase